MKKSPNRQQKYEFILYSVCKSYKRSEYNGLTDPNLSSFFSAPRRRKLLIIQKLVKYKQISPNGEINEKNCKRKVTGEVYHTTSFRKSSVSPLSTKQKPSKNSKTPEDTIKKNSNAKSERLPSIQPVSSTQFKEILNKRRSLLAKNK